VAAVAATAATVAATAAMVLALPAAAQQDRPIMGVVGTSETWDSNLFRLNDSAGPRADRYNATYVGLRVDKPYAQQRLLLDVTETAYHYKNFSNLNFNALQYRGAWQWTFTPRVSGTLSAERSQSLVNYADFRSTTQRNLRTSENQQASIDALLFGGWHLVGAAFHQSSRAEITFQVPSYRATGAEGGIKYFFLSGNSAALNFRSTHGSYIDQPLDPVALLDDGFKRSETELLASWTASGHSSFDGRLAWVDYRSNHFSQRDFSGAAGRLTWRWAPSAKLSFNFGAAQDLYPWQDSSASYRVDRRLSVGPTWQAGPRTAIRLSLEQASSDYRQPLPGFAGPQRHDTTRVALLGWDWRAWRNLSVNASVQRTRRSSSDAAFAFHDTVTTLGASLMF
jgi:exopolysaccharide biosynthesis operon protein EpsL